MVGLFDRFTGQALDDLSSLVFGHPSKDKRSSIGQLEGPARYCKLMTVKNVKNAPGGLSFGCLHGLTP